MTRWGLGVDLGTSFCAGAVATGGRVELLEVGGERRVPSAVLLTEDGRLLAGSYAQRAAGRLPDRAERNPKRYVGRAPMLLGGRPVTAVDALAALLALFVREARRRHDDTDPVRLVLTHPVAWTPQQTAVLHEVASRVLPGVEVVRLAEPVAAALHYAAGEPVRGEVAVYDLGGGTFDATVLAADGAGFRVVGAPGGDAELGGEVFDQLVYRHLGAQLAHTAPQWWERLHTDPTQLAAAADLLTEARLAKEALSDVESVSRYVPGADTDVRITRAELDTLIDDDVRRSARILAVTTAAATLRAVFVTGGAGATPLVGHVLRAAHDGLVRCDPDPKSAVALGAARQTMTAAPERRSPASEPGLITVTDDVLDARVARGRLFTWSTADGGHRVARTDPRTGRPQREVRFGRLVGWAVADAGLVVCERRDGDLLCHTLTRDLTLTATVALPTPFRPFLLAEGSRAWAVLRSPDTRYAASITTESGSLAVQVLPLDGTPAPPVVALGPAAFRYVDGARRLLDPTAPGSTAPVLAGDGRSCAVVVGRPEGPQTLLLVGPGGEVTPLPGPPRTHQHLVAGRRRLLASAAGLDLDGRRVLPRPARWAFAGRHAYALAVDPGLTLYALVGGALREMGRRPSLLGSPGAVRADDAVRVRADGDRLLVGTGDGSGSAVVEVDPAGVRVLAKAPGWLEPVGRIGDDLLARHVPGTPPGDGCADPGRLVRVTR